MTPVGNIGFKIAKTVFLMDDHVVSKLRNILFHPSTSALRAYAQDERRGCKTSWIQEGIKDLIRVILKLKNDEARVLRYTV